MNGSGRGGRPWGACVVALVLACALGLGGCTRYAPTTEAGAPAHHVVARGDTLGELSIRYGVPLQELVRANRLRDPDRIIVGQTLRIPETAARPPSSQAVARTVPARVAVPARNAPTTAAPPSAAAPSPPPPLPGADRRAVAALAGPSPASSGAPAAAPRPEAAAPAPTGPTAAAVAAPPSRPARPSAMPSRPPANQVPPLSGDGFLWPVAGEILSGFGDKPNGQRNDGINIAAADGAPIRAAEHGIVVYAGDGVAGFGNMLLVRHADGFTTAYAHAGRLEARSGDVVRRGEIIARVGSTGAVTTPQLHFELRSGRTPLDPLRHLTDRPSLVAGGSGGSG
jgi:murein DD-endopeptidase MepM/ murein hydrolase activator NlpD